MGTVALVLALAAAAASPQLHAWLHPDAGQADHECAITLYLHGGIEPTAEFILVAVALVLVAGLDLVRLDPDFVPTRHRLSLERAPPGH